MNSIEVALTNIRRSPYQSLAAWLLLTATFFVGYVLSLFAISSNQLLNYFEASPQVTAFFTVETDASVVAEVAQNTRNQPFVSSVNVVSKEAALQLYQEQNQDDPLLLELVTADILPASLEISGSSLSDIQQIATFLETQSNVDDIVVPDDVIATLEKWTATIRISGLLALSFLLGISLLVMIVVISMKVVVRRPAIKIMRLIGATKWFIGSPFVWEGWLYGLLSAITSWIGYLALTLYVTPNIKSFLGSIPIFPVAWTVFAYQLGVGILAGTILGAIAGSLAVRRIIRR